MGLPKSAPRHWCREGAPAASARRAERYGDLTEPGKGESLCGGNSSFGDVSACGLRERRANRPGCRVACGTGCPVNRTPHRNGTVDGDARLHTGVGLTFEDRFDARAGDAVRIELTALLPDRSGPEQIATAVDGPDMDLTRQPQGHAGRWSPSCPTARVERAPHYFPLAGHPRLSTRRGVLRSRSSSSSLRPRTPKKTLGRHGPRSGAVLSRGVAEQRSGGPQDPAEQVSILGSYLALACFETERTRVRKRASCSPSAS